jgi:hypothetical protein
MGAPATWIRLCLETAAGFLLAAIWLIWVVHAPTRPPSRLAHLNHGQRTRRIRAAGWLCMTGCVASLGAAILLYIE